MSDRKIDNVSKEFWNRVKNVINDGYLFALSTPVDRLNIIPKFTAHRGHNETADFFTDRYFRTCITKFRKVIYLSNILSMVLLFVI